MMLLVALAALAALFCACSAAYCAHKLKEFAPYKARWRKAVELLGELDEELQAAEQREEMLATLARQLGADQQIRAKAARAVHEAVQRELNAASAARRAIEKRRKESAWTQFQARRAKS